MGQRSGKVFCIGANRTGTTSLGAALASLGFRVGDQAAAEWLLEDWGRRRFQRIVDFCRTADAFQDIPFSLAYTYQILDHEFPGSKFILTVRGSSEEWYQSLTRFHSRILSTNRLPTAAELRAFPYRHPGWLWRVHQLVFGAEPATLFARDLYVSRYETHNALAIDYFRQRPEDLLVVNLSDPAAMRAVCEFLGVVYDGRPMPHLNRSAG